MLPKKTRREGDEAPPSKGVDIDDLGTQLEDLITHIFRCERWARIDDQIALSLDIERLRHPRPPH